MALTRGHSESRCPGFSRGPYRGHILHLDFLPCQYIDKQCLAQAFPSGSSKSQLMQWKNPQRRRCSYLGLEMLGLRNQFHPILICTLQVPSMRNSDKRNDGADDDASSRSSGQTLSGKLACYLKTLNWTNSLCNNRKWCHDLNTVSEAPSFLRVCDVCVAGEGYIRYVWSVGGVCVCMCSGGHMWCVCISVAFPLGKAWWGFAVWPPSAL